ncbi:MAG: hypothetical protein OXT67_03465 [Zetaproteobacteria bacterium]|nr:hypothetical protein [Zetaproteobacteria bacterium]
MMKTRFGWLRVLEVWLLLLTSSAKGAELPYFYQGTNAFGMGGAHTAIANDGFSLWANPAGIARVRKARSRARINLLRLPELTGGYNNKGRSLVSAVRSDGDLEAKVEKVVEAVAGDQNDFAGSAAWSRAAGGAIGFLDVPRHSPWVVGAMSHTTAKVVGDGSNAADPNAAVELVSDTFAVVGMAVSNRTNRVNLGVQLRQISRFGYEDKMLVATLAEGNFNSIKDQVLNQSNQLAATALDIGFMATLADFWFPTVGLAAYNLPGGCVANYLNPYTQSRQTVCGTVYSGLIQNPDSLHLVDPTDLRAGVSITPRMSRKLAIRFAVDMHHLTLSPDNVSFYGLDGIPVQKQLHAGVEIVIGNPLTINPVSLRFGMNQGLTTKGVSLHLGWFTLEFAEYGVDVASGATAREDKRRQITLSMDIH